MFAPMVIAGDAIGFEVVRPAAVAILGGLVTSIALTLIVLPAAYLRYGFDGRTRSLRRRAPPHARRGADEDRGCR